MNRRGFLSTLGLGFTSLALDPEKLLWVPGKKRIFIPPTPASGWDKQFAVPIAIALEDIKKDAYGWVQLLPMRYTEMERGTQNAIRQIYGL
jgi:hypothetical protein